MKYVYNLLREEVLQMREVFLVEGRGHTALFAPLRGLILEVEENERSEVAAVIDRSGFHFTDLLKVFPEILGDLLLSYRIEEEREAADAHGDFRPTSVVLFPTFDCTLRCVYCYARGGEKRIDMSEEIARVAIDFVIENARLEKIQECSLELHGGGEPTCNWQIFQFSVDYFQKCARETGVTAEVSLSTNGMLSEQRVHWIANRFKEVQVSIDGPEDIQNAQRPVKGGEGSFGVVSRAITSFLAKGTKVVLHAVVTKLSVSRMPEIVRFFARSFPGAAIQMEPVCQCGRGTATGQNFPDPKLFVYNLIRAEEEARSYGVELFYSGGGPRLMDFRGSFCGVLEPNFVVTPMGLVTACHEVAELTHPLADFLVYGNFDVLSQRFLFDNQKICRLRASATCVNPVCRDCFARFYCAGDCFAKRMENGGRNDPQLNPRCEVNRELTRYYVFEHLLGRGKEESNE